MNHLFEISWEVCNKVGGINTVISSKSSEAKKICTNYFFIGPYFENNREFREEETPSEFLEIFENLRRNKVHCHYGSWVSVESKVILIDSRELMQRKNDIKKELWENFKIDSLFSGFDFEEPAVWSWAVGMFLEEFEKRNDKIVAQFHEWLSGCGILYLKMKNSKVSTVFTTHATVLERSMAPEKKQFVGGNTDEEAKKRRVIDKHSVEKESALNCDVFTSVSDFLAESCLKVLGRKPDVVVYNGLDLKKYEFENSRKRLEEFTKSFFYPYYYIDIKNTFFYFISGRYEVSSKGIDTLIKSLGVLNEQLKKDRSEKNVVVFFLIPAATNRIYEEVLNNYVLFSKINERITDRKDDIEEGIIEKLFFGKENLNDLMDMFTKGVKIKKKNDTPYITTHELSHTNDEISLLLRNNNLNNYETDKVKVIYYPTYLEEGDGLLNLNYYEFTKGFDLGVFPSFYEPWGYTPLEGIYVGVPTITTNLSGFGDYIKDKENTGVIVIDRHNKDEEETAKELTEELKDYMDNEAEDIMKKRIEAEIFSKKFSWKILIKNYEMAYEMAERKFEENE
jgi:glycogen synthase